VFIFSTKGMLQAYSTGCRCYLFGLFLCVWQTLYYKLLKPQKVHWLNKIVFAHRLPVSQEWNVTQIKFIRIGVALYIQKMVVIENINTNLFQIYLNKTEINKTFS